MRGKQADLHRLFHMVEYCRKLQAVGEDAQTYENFIAEENYRLVDVNAFYTRQLGELSHGLSDEMKDRLSDIPWKQINDMRNKLIHHYGKPTRKLFGLSSRKTRLRWLNVALKFYAPKILTERR